MTGSLAGLDYLWSRGPLRWLASLAAGAFFLMASYGGTHGSFAEICGSLRPGAVAGILDQYIRFHSPWWLLGGWLLMVAAMMPPLLALPVSHVWQSTFERDRAGALASFALGYSTVWVAAAPPLFIVALLWEMAVPGPGAVLAALALALLWSASPLAQVARNRCHRLLPINPFGLGFAGHSFRQGLESGRWCALACWPWMMLPLMVREHHAAAMAGVTCWLFLERLERPRPAGWRWPPAFRTARGLILRG